MSSKKIVSKEDFRDFVLNYPNKLTSDLCGANDTFAYHDFTLENSIVAIILMGADYSDESEYIYKILDN